MGKLADLEYRGSVVRRLLHLARKAAVGVALRPSVIGAAYLLALTAWASSAPIVEANDRSLGTQAREVGDMVTTYFTNDIHRISVAIACTAAALGAVLGVISSLLVRLHDRFARRAPRSGWRLAKPTVVVLVVLHSWLVVWGMARAPQGYVESFYARGGIRRIVELTATDVLGARACFWLGVSMVVVYVLGWPWKWGGRYGGRLARLAGLLRSRAAMGTAAVGLLIVGIAEVPRAHARSSSRPNVVILAADSLRADRLTPEVAPHLSALADRGTRFDRAYVSLPRTFPSWVTILTGRHPHHHGVRSMFARYEDRAKNLDALPSRLRAAGYRTAVVSDYAGDVFGRVDLGFDEVDTPTFNFHELIRQRAIERQTPLLPLLDSRAGRAAFPVIREWNEAADADLLASDAIRAIDHMGGDPFFLTVFFSTAHFPYAAPAPYYGRFTDPAYRGRFKYHKPVGLGADERPDAADVRQVRGLYDGAVASIDDAADRVVRHLESEGLLDNTIILITADHGETLFDNGHGQGHGDHLFGDEGTHVPLVIVDPRTPGARRESAIVRDVDIAPTLYGLLGVPAPKDLDGRSVTGHPAPALAYAETELWMGDVPALPDEYRLPYPALSQLTELDVAHGYEVVLRKEVAAVTTVARHRMVRDDRYKLLYIPTRQRVVYQLYDTQSDPQETHDVAADHPDVVGRLRTELWKWMLEDPAMMQRGGYLVPRQVEPLSNDAIDAIRIGPSKDDAPAGDTP
jgi:arylsulfatase A-like enzyme